MTKHYRVQLTRAAERDLDDIASYLARGASPAVAAAFLTSMLDRVAEHEAFPERGKVPRELDALGISTFRELSVAPYRIIYRVGVSDVVITVIADDRRDMQFLLERRLLLSMPCRLQATTVSQGPCTPPYPPPVVSCAATSAHRAAARSD